MGRLILIILLFVCLCGRALALSSSRGDASTTVASSDTSITSTTDHSTAVTVTSTGKMSSSSSAGETQSSAGESSTEPSTVSTTATASSSTTRAGVTITTVNTLNDGTASNTPLPRLSSTASSTTTYPTPIIPVTNNNPFSKESNAPEGTVFIAVGSVIGGIALAILGWRGLVAYSLHKSLKASSAAYASEPKGTGTSSGRGGFFGSKRQNTGAFYATGAGSAVSLDQLTSTGRAVNNARPISAYDDIGMPRTGPSFNTSTFYSPTAGAMGMSAAMGNGLSGLSTNRSSTYLPSGYYGANNGASSSASLSVRYSSVPQNQRAPSPGAILRTESSLAVPQHGQRVPSVYLDDLLDSDRS
ncbi:hypothetical protein V1520DRAFT_393456 [Lipomyces starkeyi]|uniref:Mid2 domain-containing protein n=1 Tax=Lipomyces starkeyi NRRL Y-11557 TaxID=675824 RepID=A0A1E3Q1D6_LIPST|nr:hypothetical protein LIPSTDRAFT_64535 [Lipomyces starkeyi NRRL Y-11557]